MIVVALVAAGVLGGELYARSRADKIVASIVECTVEDGAKASFDPLPPFLHAARDRALHQHQHRDRRQPDPRRQGHEGQAGHQGCADPGNR